jgi:hypothetical protein
MLPVNAPKSAHHNNHHDGFMNFMQRDEEVNYFPSRWAPVRGAAGGGCAAPGAWLALLLGAPRVPPARLHHLHPPPAAPRPPRPAPGLTRCATRSATP